VAVPRLEPPLLLLLLLLLLLSCTSWMHRLSYTIMVHYLVFS
jgi:hypothetical protein